MYFNNVEWFVLDLWNAEYFVLRWIICTKLHNLYLQRWMVLTMLQDLQLLNDLNGSVKLPPAKYPLEDILQKSSRVYPSYCQSYDVISL